MFNRAGFNQLSFNRNVGKYGKISLSGSAFIFADPTVTIIFEPLNLSGLSTFEFFPSEDRQFVRTFESAFEAAAEVWQIFKTALSGVSSFQISGKVESLDVFSWLGRLSPGDVLTINTENKTIYKNNINALKYFSGKFFDISPGNNTIVYSDSESNRGLTLKSVFRERYI